MKIQNTTDLRKMLLETIEGILSEKIDPRQAHAISSLSGRVLQSARLDMEAARLAKHSEAASNTSLTKGGVRLVEGGKKVA